MASANSIKAGEAFIILRAIDKASPVLRSLSTKILNVGRDIRNFGLAFLGVGAAITSAFIKPVRIASEVTEQQNKFFQIFGTKIGKDVEDRMKAIGRETGRTYLKMYKFAGAFGGLLKGQGATTEAAAEMTKSLVKMGVDFSSFNDILDDTREGSMRRFVSALSGSAEVLDQYGVAAKESALGPALEKMFGVGVRGATELQKSTARAFLIYKSMKQQNALDDAIRTNKELANGVRNFKDQLYEVQYFIGQALLPIIGSAVQYLIRGAMVLSQWVQQNRNLVIAFALIGAAILAIGVAITGLGFALMIVGGIISGIAQILVVIKALIIAIKAVMYTEVVLIFAVIAGILAVLLQVTGQLYVILNVFGEILSWVTMIGKAIWKAFSTGNFELAWKIFFKTLVYGWDVLWTRTQSFIRQITQGFFIAAVAIKNGLLNAFDMVWHGVQSAFQLMLASLQSRVSLFIGLVASAVDKMPGMGGKADSLRHASAQLEIMATRSRNAALSGFTDLRDRVKGRQQDTRKYAETLREDFARWQKIRQAALNQQWEELYELIKEANKPPEGRGDIVPSEPMPTDTGPSGAQLAVSKLPEALEQGTLAAARQAHQNSQTQALRTLVDQTEEANADRKDQNAMLEEMLANTGAV